MRMVLLVVSLTVGGGAVPAWCLAVFPSDRFRRPTSAAFATEFLQITTKNRREREMGEIFTRRETPERSIRHLSKGKVYPRVRFEGREEVLSSAISRSHGPGTEWWNRNGLRGQSEVSNLLCPLPPFLFPSLFTNLATAFVSSQSFCDCRLKSAG